MRDNIDYFLKDMGIKYTREKDNVYFYRYLFKVGKQECEILFADKEHIYMSAGFYNQRVICDRNENLNKALERLKELIEKRRLEC